jgi:DNA-binding transcriptional ArsR family regulator
LVLVEQATTQATLFGSTGLEQVMTFPVFDEHIDDDQLDQMMDNATIATNYLKAISHEGRLMILCNLVNGEKSVTELETLLSARQAAVSQQLGRLRLEGLVRPRRDGKTIYYSLSDDKSRKIIELVYKLFCKTD